MRQIQGGAQAAGVPMSFGKSRARLLNEDQVTRHVRGRRRASDEAKEEVGEIVDFL